MKLLTKENIKSLPALYSQEKLGLEQKAVVKFFTPWSNWTWYATEFDENTGLFYGLVDGTEKEMGTWTIEELKSVNGPFGLKIERDMYFKSIKIKELM